MDKDLALSISKKIIEINDNLSIMPSFSTDTTYLNSLSENYIYYLDHRKVNLSYKNNVLLYILTKAYISYGITMDDFYNNDIGYLTIEEYNNIPDVIFNENNILTIWIDQKNRKHHDITLNIEIQTLRDLSEQQREKYKIEHIERLKNGSCNVESGIVFLEVLTICEKIMDHCFNVAIATSNYVTNDRIITKQDYYRKVYDENSELLKSKLNEFSLKYEI